MASPRHPSDGSFSESFRLLYGFFRLLFGFLRSCPPWKSGRLTRKAAGLTRLEVVLTTFQAVRHQEGSQNHQNPTKRGDTTHQCRSQPLDHEVSPRFLGLNVFEASKIISRSLLWLKLSSRFMTPTQADTHVAKAKPPSWSGGPSWDQIVSGRGQDQTNLMHEPPNRLHFKDGLAKVASNQVEL